MCARLAMCSYRRVERANEWTSATTIVAHRVLFATVVPVPNISTRSRVSTRSYRPMARSSVVRLRVQFRFHLRRLYRATKHTTIVSSALGTRLSAVDQTSIAPQKDCVYSKSVRHDQHHIRATTERKTLATIKFISETFVRAHMCRFPFSTLA